MKYPIAKQIHLSAQSIFIPLPKGKRPLREIVIENKKTRLEITMPYQLDTYDEDLFLTILSMANPIETGKRATEEQESGLKTDITKMNDGYKDKKLGAINIIKSKYELIKEMKDREPVEADYQALEKSLKRLFKTSIFIETETMKGGSYFLSYAMEKSPKKSNKTKNAELISITINPIYSAIFLGDMNNLSYNIQNRKQRMQIESPTGRSLYSYLLKNISNKESKTYKIDTLINAVYQDENFSYDRKNTMKKALLQINELDGWSATDCKNNTFSIYRNEKHIEII